MDLKPGFQFVPQPALAPFTKVPASAPLPSAGVWGPQPHPGPLPVITPPIPGPPISPAPIQPPVISAPAAPIQTLPDLGPLKDLQGEWAGDGFNVIWRPNNSSGSDHFLELNRTSETIEFVEIPGDIPNRGLLQGDIAMKGLRYLQQIKDANTNSGLHIEPGLWALVPSTLNPLEPQTVVRMASIPHGTSILAQGTASTSPGGPFIPPISIAPFIIAMPNQQPFFAESNLLTPSSFRSPQTQMGGITQAMVTNPNSLLQNANIGKTIKQTTQINISSGPAPVVGGGVANTAFLIGANGPNAQASIVTASFWIELVEGINGEPDFFQLQYSQMVMLNFAGLSWPHVSVGTLRKF